MRDFLRECVREYWEYELHLPPLPRERLSVRLCVEEIWPKIYWTSLRENINQGKIRALLMSGKVNRENETSCLLAPASDSSFQVGQKICKFDRNSI